jgi:uncharacterized membrane protein YeaQ/YmgE (transglycosylase-associated protein family)
MGILWTVVIGVLVGASAKLLLPGKDAGGVIMTTLLGVAGATTASLFGFALGWYPTMEAGVSLMGAALLGAVLVLFAYRRLVIARRTV